MDQWLVFTFGPTPGECDFVGPFGDPTTACDVAQKLRDAGITAYVDRLVTTQEAVRRHGK